MIDYIKSEYSLQDLEQFRDENGFIDLSEAGIVITEESREEKGTVGRIKNWVDFNGKKVLLRGSAIDNYSFYAELIVEEIAKKIDVETAHYDLIKIKDDEGKYVTGVLSESIIDNEYEDLISLHEFIGDEPESDDLDYMSVIRYEFTIDKFRQYLEENSNGFGEEFIENIILEYQKRLMFGLIVADTDKHTENISFVINKNGENSIKISPNYDSEFSLLLDYEKDMVDYFSQNINALKDEIDVAEPKIGIIRPINDGGWNSLWKDTFEALIENDDLYDYYNDSIRDKIDIEEILNIVETRIKAPIPESVKVVVKNSFESRNNIIEKLMDGELEYPTEFEEDIDKEDLLSSILSIGIQSKVRTGEQVFLGQKIEENIKENREEKDFFDYEK